MARLSTAGMSSCGTAAIGHLKWMAPEEDIKYLENPDVYETNLKEKFVKAGKKFIDVGAFYSFTLYRTTQELGQTSDMPLTMLLAQINKHNKVSRLFITCTLNPYQFQINTYYKDLLKKNGFRHKFTFPNYVMGNNNYFFVRRGDKL